MKKRKGLRVFSEAGRSWIGVMSLSFPLHLTCPRIYWKQWIIMVRKISLSWHGSPENHVLKPDQAVMASHGREHPGCPFVWALCFCTWKCHVEILPTNGTLTHMTSVYRTLWHWFSLAMDEIQHGHLSEGRKNVQQGLKGQCDTGQFMKI
jgi:hypothetical protein